MKEEVDADIFKKVAGEIKDEQKIVNRQLGVICAVIAVYAALVLITFFVLRANPSVACAFSNNRLIQGFWPPNGAIMDAFAESRYSQADRCVFFATRSLASMSMLPAVVFFVIRQLFASDRHHVQGMMTVFIVMLFASFLSAYIGPTEDVTSYRISLYSPIEVNILKSMIHIFGFYLAAFVLAFRIPAYIRSKRTR